MSMHERRGGRGIQLVESGAGEGHDLHVDLARIHISDSAFPNVQQPASYFLHSRICIPNLPGYF